MKNIHDEEADMNYLIKFLLFCTTSATLAACGPLPDPRALIASDLQPPIFKYSDAVAPEEIEIRFHEEVSASLDEYRITPPVDIEKIDSEQNVVRIVLKHPLDPGGEYHVSGTVSDNAGNSLKFITKLYGFNPDVPDLLLSEITVRGSGNHPDCVELVTRTAGNLAGVTVFEGTPGNWDNQIVFPSVEVGKDEYIVVHFKPEGTGEEINEINDINASGGLDASPTGRDFWVEEGDGLSGNNGVITVCRTANGPIIDGVLYSNRTSDSDERYAGFGTKHVLARAVALYEAGEWDAEWASIRPEDAVNPEGSTATRSLCRKLDVPDSNRAEDWYIVPTRGASFGAPNCTDVYVPD